MDTFRAENHIIGKVYELTQENMNAMIREIERLQRLHHRHESETQERDTQLETLMDVIIRLARDS